MSLPHIETDRLIVRLAQPEDAPAIVRYYQENLAFHKPFDLCRSDEFFTLPYWRRQVEQNLWEFHQGKSLRLFFFDRLAPAAVPVVPQMGFMTVEPPLDLAAGPGIVGCANFTEIRGYPLYNTSLGYSLAAGCQGQGYMQEGLAAAIGYAFERLGLRRVTACYLPRNQRSGNVLRRLGFVVEGYSRDYLPINGVWEDHILTSLLNAQWEPEAP
jgi:[ribosomal protein S5]-alanine N-acetyltransferase